MILPFLALMAVLGKQILRTIKNKVCVYRLKIVIQMRYWPKCFLHVLGVPVHNVG